jgi:metal-responsive CopG/Arc/MetJ family transcriptional regulator
MGRPRTLPEGARDVLVRLPAETIEELDQWVEEIREEQVGASGVTRANLIRDLLEKALKERRAKRRKGAKR